MATSSSSVPAATRALNAVPERRGLRPAPCRKRQCPRRRPLRCPPFPGSTAWRWPICARARLSASRATPAGRS
eukprot:321781-Prymnesium_polylepis.1